MAECLLQAGALSKSLVYLDQDKCVGCNRCITVCPVRLTNREAKDAKGNLVIDIRSEYCIDCGRCIRHCDKKARKFHDDTEEFLNDLHSNKRLSILFAPALKTNYPEYKKLLGYFRKFNVKQIYDTSFGAEITTWAYLKFIKASGTDGWISQPCPAVVNMIEKYFPELLPKLIPIHSPAMCTVIYMRKYMNITEDIAFLSPCIGKKDEFSRYGQVKYNVTYKHLMEYIRNNNINISSFPETEPDSPPGELGSFYPSPGGLRENVNFHTNNSAWVRQVEGSSELYKYFKQYESRLKDDRPLPLLVDVLNCMRGCNDGTATDKNIKSDDVEYLVHKMHDSASKSKNVKRKKYKHFKTFDKILKLEDFKCSYKPQNIDTKMPSKALIEQAFLKLLKETEEERDINCKSCGYDTCAEMAEMIARGINTEQNCIHYAKKQISIENDKLEDFNIARKQRNEMLKQGVKGISDSLIALKDGSHKQQQAVMSIASGMEKISSDTDALHDLIGNVSNDMTRYLTLTKDIVNVSEQTNLLSLNASVEAARAGQHGKGFAVVAGEVRALAQKAKQSAQASTEINDSVQPLLEQMNKISDSFIVLIDNLNNAVRDISEEISTTVVKAEEISNLSESIMQEATNEQQM